MALPAEGEHRWFRMETADSHIAWSEDPPPPGAAVGVATTRDRVLYLGSKGPLPDPLVYRQALRQFGSQLARFADVRIGLPFEMPPGLDPADPAWEPVLRALMPPMLTAVEQVEAAAPDTELWAVWKRDIRRSLPDIELLVERGILARRVFTGCRSWQEARMLQHALAASRPPPCPPGAHQERWANAQARRWSRSDGSINPRTHGPPVAARNDGGSCEVGPLVEGRLERTHEIVCFDEYDFDPVSGTVAGICHMQGRSEVHVVHGGVERIVVLDQPHEVRVAADRVWCLTEHGLYDLSNREPRLLFEHEGAFRLHAVGSVVWFGDGRLWSWDGEAKAPHGDEVRRVTVGRGGVVWRSDRYAPSDRRRRMRRPEASSWWSSPLDRVAPRRERPLQSQAVAVQHGEAWFGGNDRELGTDALVWSSNGRRRARTFGLAGYRTPHDKSPCVLLPPDSGMDDHALVYRDRQWVWLPHEVLPPDAAPHRAWVGE